MQYSFDFKLGKIMRKSKRKRKYAKPLSLYPLKREEAIAICMKVDPRRIEKALKRRRK
jgi:hypothetical protein